MAGILKSIVGRITLFAVTLLVIASLSLTLWQPATVTATTTIEVLSGSGTWNRPANLAGDLLVECWGGGGGGGGGAASQAGGGGGGGAYARATITSPTASYSYAVGAGGAGGAAGANGSIGATSTFHTVCIAQGGRPGLTAGTAGNGGSGTHSTGDQTFSGGNGAAGGAGEAGVGGGGGSSASTSAAGNNASGPTGAAGVDGTGSGSGAGNGGGVSDSPGSNGFTFGGAGGGGGERDGSPNEDGGVGAAGTIRLTYDVDTTPPTPSPPSFATTPTPASASSITMTAGTVTDTQSSVEYYFTATTSDCGADYGTGSTDSGWQSSASYTDTGLDVGKCYGYMVTARDAAGNYTSTSTASSTYIVADPGKLDYSTKTQTTITIYNNANGNSATTEYAILASSTADVNWDGFYITSSGATSTAQTWITDTNIDGTVLSNMATNTQYQFDVVASSSDTITATTTSYIKTASAGTASTTVLTSGSGTWTVPSGVNEVTIECWGGGGNGGTGSNSSLGGGGGGGGAFAKVDTHQVTQGSGLTYVVGGAAATTSFSNGICLAQHGFDGIDALSGTFYRDNEGGYASESTGDWSYSGGNGFDTGLSTGSGGGGAATSTSDGSDSSSVTGGANVFGTGGDGGDGGTAGGASGGTGGNGTVAGGGGGGGGGGTVSGGTGGSGAAGKIELTYWIDDIAPDPDIPYFSTIPTSTSNNSITMTSVTATDDSNPVEYYFTATTSDCGVNYGSGSSDSGWQTSTTYTETDLQVNKCYGYMVTARDASGNYTSTSTASSTYTRANIPGFLTFSSRTENTINIQNNNGGNPNGNPDTEFAIFVLSSNPSDVSWNNRYVDATGNPSASIVWLTDGQIDSLSTQDMASSTDYTVQVKARNGDGTETSFTEAHVIATLNPQATRLNGARLQGVRLYQLYISPHRMRLTPKSLTSKLS